MFWKSGLTINMTEDLENHPKEELDAYDGDKDEV